MTENPASRSRMEGGIQLANPGSKTGGSPIRQEAATCLWTNLFDLLPGPNLQVVLDRSPGDLNTQGVPAVVIQVQSVLF